MYAEREEPIGTVLYIGGFELPDGNAAAQRVIGNARLFTDLGYQVVFLATSPESFPGLRTTKYLGFDCYETSGTNARLGVAIRGLYDISALTAVVEEIGHVDIVIAYNYPAVALARLNRYCRRTGIRCVGDVTEWYGTAGRSIVYRLVKGFDSALRMRLVHRSLDGLIVVSEYLEEFYSGTLRTLRLPPLVDSQDDKWSQHHPSGSERFTLIYAGSPNRTKERLDLVIRAVWNVSRMYPVVLDVVGITREEYAAHYPGTSLPPESCGAIRFWGRLPHSKAIELVARANASVVVRDENRVTRAGFPTKVVESITCGTPVIGSSHSDLQGVLTAGRNGVLVSLDALESDLTRIVQSGLCIDVNRSEFDYREYRPQTAIFLHSVLSQRRASAGDLMESA
ncbi:MAG: glycosyltransferase [Coriobacteriia bacterium]